MTKAGTRTPSHKSGSSGDAWRVGGKRRAVEGRPSKRAVEVGTPKYFDSLPGAGQRQQRETRRVAAALGESKPGLSVSGIGIHLRGAVGRRARPRSIVYGTVTEDPGKQLCSRADGGAKFRVLNLGRLKEPSAWRGGRRRSIRLRTKGGRESREDIVGDPDSRKSRRGRGV